MSASITKVSDAEGKPELFIVHVLCPFASEVNPSSGPKQAEEGSVSRLLLKSTSGGTVRPELPTKMLTGLTLMLTAE